MPTVQEVRRSFQPQDPRGAYISASIDFKAAHKRVKVHDTEQGLLLFAFTPSSGEGAGHSFGLHPLNSEGILYGTCSQGDGWSLPFPFSQENGGE